MVWLFKNTSMTFTKTRFLLAFLILLQLNVIAQSGKHKMHLATTDDARVAISITIDDIPDQKFIFTIPEVYTLKGFEGGQGGLGSFSGQQWKITDDGASVALEDKNYKYSINFDLQEAKDKYSLKWKIRFTNNSDHTLYDLAAFNCVSMKAAPLFKDDMMERTWVQDINGNKKYIRDVAKTQGPGRRTMQFYPAKGGVKDLSNNGWIQQWDVNSTEVLSGKKMSILSKDAKWVVDTKVNGQVAYFFNNFEITHGCIHAAPLISSSLKPGKTAVSKGSINFVRQ
jgi:hypothetical protein